MTQHWGVDVPQGTSHQQKEADFVLQSEGKNPAEGNLQDAEPRRLAAGEWLRAVSGFSAPFGHDGLPTVWG